MIPSVTTFFESYTPAADVLVIAVCVVFVILIRTAYINRTRSFRYLRHMIYLTMTASVADLFYHFAVNDLENIAHVYVYIARIGFHLCLYMILWMFVLYVKEAVRLTFEKNKLYFLLATVGVGVLFISEIAEIVFRFGFYIEEDHTIHNGAPIFICGYVFFGVLILVMLFKYRERVLRAILVGVMASVGISFIIMLIQQWVGESSYTVFTFLFPIYALLYLAHSNPYDTEMGAVDERAFDDLMRISADNCDDLYLMSLYMHEFDGKGQQYPEEIQKLIKKFTIQFFKSPTLFMISGGHIILVVRTALNPEYVENGQRMIDEFMKAYDNYKIDYKIVFMKTDYRFAHDNDYVNLIKYLHYDMKENSILKAQDKDINSYLRYKYIVSELNDINVRHDLNDPRVLVYCQPVYNIKTGKYDTAESLMRLKLEETGLIYPDEFIYVAERFRYIYTLTQIILNKTCRQIKEFIDKGYDIQRISVNFSVYDVREESFCDTVEKIIKDSGIPYDKIAIEITESQNERDFENIKKRINELKDSGVKFYLDDFGTGYSNFERIMELPFDIVKFDRSLVIASGSGGKYKAIVSNLASMFNDVDYSVLYEGVEDEADELRCIDMNARYLQGYKYSRPIPIDKLEEYLDKPENA